MPDNPSGALAASHGIGSLKWLVTLYRRDQAPAEDLALQETLAPLATVHADIQSAYMSTFFESTQIETPVTHIINIRWQRYLATVDVIARTGAGNDGVAYTELFRVRRTKEIGGRKRFLQMECELEHARPTPNDADATRNALLTEPYTPTLWDDQTTGWDDNATVWQEGAQPATTWDPSNAAASPTQWDDAGTTWKDAP